MMQMESTQTSYLSSKQQQLLTPIASSSSSTSTTTSSTAQSSNSLVVPSSSQSTNNSKINGNKKIIIYENIDRYQPSQQPSQHQPIYENLNAFQSCFNEFQNRQQQQQLKQQQQLSYLTHASSLLNESKKESSTTTNYSNNESIVDNDIKVQLWFCGTIVVIYIKENMKLDQLFDMVRSICRFDSQQLFTIKWVDEESDPCTISSQCELDEAIRLYYLNKESELIIHVFANIPERPGTQCAGEDRSIYRRGARRWRKIYLVNGHKYQAKRFARTALCKVCADRIWGLGRQGYKCLECKIMVHKRCHKYISQTCDEILQQQHIKLNQSNLSSNTNASLLAPYSTLRPQYIQQQQQHQQVPQSQSFNQQLIDDLKNKIKLKQTQIDNGSHFSDDLNDSKFNSENGYVSAAVDVCEPTTTNTLSKGFKSKTTPTTTDNNDSKQMNLDKFDLIKVIGRGSYAKVFLVEYKATGKCYAMKVIKKTTVNDDEDIDWVQTEKHVFEQGTNHPFLVGLHSCFQTESHLFFVIEYLCGGDLMYHMQNKRKLPEDHARFYAAEISLALDFLHSKGIIYRDLKLDNVLLDIDGHIKLTDYGMCKEGLSRGEKTSTFCGTPNYIAPEMLRGEDYDFSVDWWALGVLMYEMMAGRSPFELMAENYSENPDLNTEDHLFQVILEKPIRIPRSLSVKAGSVLKAFLQKQPEERLGTYDGLREIQQHLFFKQVDWHALEHKQIQPPYKPPVKSERDLTNIDKLFTNEPVVLSPVSPNSLARIQQTEFDGFEYINPLILSDEIPV